MGVVITKENVSDFFKYEDGVLYRKGSNRAGPHSWVKARIWEDRRQPHSIVYTVYIGGKMRQVAHIILALHGVEIPEGCSVLYLDKDRKNFDISNLRVASVSDIRGTHRLNRNNSLGYKNVYWSKIHKRFVARVEKSNGSVLVRRSLTFECLRDAVSAANRMRAELYGEFAYDGVAPHLDVVPSIEYANKIREQLLSEHKSS
jgi:hypothetical protein